MSAPSLLDQHGRAKQVRQHEAGLMLTKVARLTPEGLPKAIRGVMGDGEMCLSAAAFGARVRDERGVERAIEAITGLLV